LSSFSDLYDETHCSFAGSADWTRRDFRGALAAAGDESTAGQIEGSGTRFGFVQAVARAPEGA
jgi:hypothetical protein